MKRSVFPRLLTVLLACAGPAFGAVPGSAARTRFEDSVMAVPTAAPGSRAHVVRTVLTPDEAAQPLDFVVSLRMRGFTELQGRLQAGSAVSHAELESKYLPLKADFDRVVAWVQDQGFTVTLIDQNHTSVFARGSIARVAQAMGLSFARVQTADGEFTSAVTAPSLPADLAAVVLGIGGLQPHLLLHHSPLQRAAGVTNVSSHITPSDVAATYNVPAGLDGTGQTIAVIMAGIPLTSDLTAFWQATGINQSLSNYSVVSVNGGPTSASQTANVGEATLDVEWSSGMAPGAQLRLYAVTGLTTNTFQQACVMIMNDGAAKIISYSAAGLESDLPGSQLQANSQTLTQVVASGITIFSSSGDGGSNPNPLSNSSNGYSASNPLVAGYPASDPNITGVGGTTLNVNSSWSATSEVAWSQIGKVTTNPLASGGGVSGFFPRPSWQTGSGLPAGSTRCVPDISAMSSANPPAGNTGAVVVLNGQVIGLIGTSVSAPIWAGMGAIIDQARAAASLPPVGLLNRLVYVLLGTPALNDITSGNNGAYNAGPGYDLCTGVGSPNLTNLIAQIDNAVSETPAPSSPVKAGTAVTLNATSPAQEATYQWLLNGVAITGATSATYAIPVAGAADNGAYTVAITTSSGTLTYGLGTLTTVSDARVINLSARADVQTGGNILIAGYVIAGSGQKAVLVRGIGPALAPFGVTGFLAAPDLTLINSSSVTLASNTAWGGSAALVNVMKAVGAFALPANSLDTALELPLTAGSYTAQVSGVNGTSGVALAEVYDADTGTPATRLINISARADVQSGSNSLIAGFVIAGGPTGADETILIRGIGPALAGFGVAGSLASPVLTLFDSSQNAVATNQGWSSGSNAGASTVKVGIKTATAAIMAQVGAFSIPVGSADAAMVVTLPPGSYTAQVAGAATTSGVGLVEVYEVR